MKRVITAAQTVAEARENLALALHEFRKADHDRDIQFHGFVDADLARVAIARAMVDDREANKAIHGALHHLLINGRSVSEILQAEAKAERDRETLRQIVREVLAEGGQR